MLVSYMRIKHTVFASHSAYCYVFTDTPKFYSLRKRKAQEEEEEEVKKKLQKEWDKNYEVCY